MRWWCASTRMIQLFVTPLVAVSVAFFLANVELLLPAFGTGSPFAGVRIYALLPLMVGVSTSYSLAAANRPTYVSAARHTKGLDYALCMIPLAVTMTVSLGFAAAGWSEAGPMIRNVAGVLGLQMLVGGFIGYRAQSIVPVIYVFMSAIFGREHDATAYAWAWPLGEGGVLKYWFLPLLFLLCGTLAHFRLTARRVEDDA